MQRISINKIELIDKFADIKLLFDECLKNYTYTKTGGPVDILAFPKAKDEIITLVEYCRSHDIPWIVIGNASNLIVRDGGIRGMVIMLEYMKQIFVKENQIIVEAGKNLIDTTHVALENHLTGFEFACGIPGSVGGAVFMNAGAYGGEVKDIFTSADVLLPDGTVCTLTNEDMKFSYRHSVIQEMHCIVLQATFLLKPGNYEEINGRMDELTKLREAKQPLEYPSCGSVFKRPVGHFAGKLIHDAGLQGLKWGGAQVSEKHAGFIVNIDHATATDYVELITHIQRVVKEKFDVILEKEVRIIGDVKNEPNETEKKMK